MMPSLMYNPAPVMKIFFPGIIWYSQDKILVTLDDAPQRAHTPALLRTLEALDIKALFFCIGRNIEENPGLLKEIVSAGHSAANHSYTHLNMRLLSDSAQKYDLMRTNDIIANITGRKPEYFRPPYGKFNLRLLKTARNCGLTTMMWSLITFDYKNDLKLCKFAFQKLRHNAVVVLHDSPKSSEIITDCLYNLKEAAEKHGFKIGSPEECLK